MGNVPKTNCASWFTNSIYRSNRRGVTMFRMEHLWCSKTITRPESLYHTSTIQGSTQSMCHISKTIKKSTMRSIYQNSANSSDIIHEITEAVDKLDDKTLYRIYVVLPNSTGELEFLTKKNFCMLPSQIRKMIWLITIRNPSKISFRPHDGALPSIDPDAQTT